MNRRLTRRDILAATTASAVSLAGCLGSEDSPDEEMSTESDGTDGDNGDTDGENTETESESSSDGDAAETDANWQEVPIEDVTTGETFTIAELDQPVLVHTFAIWCSICSRQHEQFKTFRKTNGDGVAMVELNIASDESGDAIRDHAESNGFDWRFGTAPDAVLSQLVDMVGPRMTSPPQSPVLLVCPSGEMHVLDDSRVVTAERLQAAIDTNC